VRGQDSRSGSLFSYVDLEHRLRSDHPVRTIRTLVDEALTTLDGRFGEIYSEIGRLSIPPEQLLRAMLLQAFYSVRSERQLMERLDSTCCSAGSSGSASMIPSGTLRPFPRTATVCSPAAWRRPF